MRTVNFVTINSNTIAGHFKEANGDLAEIRGYYLPEDHCTIGPDIVEWINDGILPRHTALHTYNGVCEHVSHAHPIK